MKRRVNIIFIVTLAIALYPGTVLSQTGCKVLKLEIDSAYLGECKRELAHGIGEAWGRDHYLGEFKKGFPDGEGVYNYSDGSVYNGNFSKGLRHGFGEYSTIFEGKDTTIAGIWEKDIFIGAKPKGPGYKILRRTNVDRYRVVRMGEGDKVILKVISTSGISEVTTSGTSGQEFNYTGQYGYTYVQFPFTLRATYVKMNKMETARLNVIFEIEISQPGEWRIELY